MRAQVVFFLLILCVVTDLVLRPFYATGQSTLDVPLLFLLWLALREPARLVLAAWSLLVIARWLGSAESILVTVVPSLISVGLIVATRGGLNVREVAARVVWIALATFVFQTVDVALRWSSLTDRWLVVTEGAVIAGLSGFILIPILDIVGPPRRMR